jgi:hypothetical protein
MIKEGGPIEQWKTERGRRAMEQAAYGLTAPVTSDKWRVTSASERVTQNSETRGQTSDIRPPVSDRPLEIHVLTGNKFWYQTAFCLWSLAKTSGREVRAVVHDDGSLRREQAEQMQRVFPGTRVEWIDEAEAKLNRLLPESSYPVLRRRRRELPLMKKILDVHAGGTGWNLFMDADLLFFRRAIHSSCWRNWPGPRCGR